MFYIVKHPVLNYFVGIDCADGYHARVQPDILIAPEGDMVKFTCSTNLDAAYPMWKIDDAEYDVASHPPDIKFNGMSIEFQMPHISVEVRCFFKAYLEGSIIDICSNTAVTLLPEGSRG